MTDELISNDTHLSGHSELVSQDCKEVFAPGGAQPASMPGISQVLHSCP
ncbi:hypothetical protein [Roseovarius pacificus]|nr:hypothetical protein [Roseovarius pacificus]